MLFGRDFLPGRKRYRQRACCRILSHRLWSQKFGADREIIGKEIRMNGEPYTVVGVMSPGQAERLPHSYGCLWRSSRIRLITIPLAYGYRAFEAGRENGTGAG